MSQQHGNNNEFSVELGQDTAWADTSFVAAPGTGLAIYITDIGVFGGATARTFTLEQGTTTAKWKLALGINGASNVMFKTPKKLASNTALTLTSDGASVGAFVTVGGFIGRG